jgi:ElaB/YqjD/DUF883 family membrane-anchored ribosome-binding protein
MKGSDEGIDLAAEIENLKSDLAKVRDDFASLSGELLREGQRSAKAMKESAQAGVEQSMQTLQQYVQERPITTVLLTFAAGAVFGRLWMGRR